MSYVDYYSLKEEPFSNAPVSTRFYYNSAQHSQALVRVMHAVDSMKGLALVVGDIGSGKTTLARRILDQLPEEDYEASLLVIIHSAITADWLLLRIATLLGVENPGKEKVALLGEIYEVLKKNYEDGKKTVILVDEAQMLQTREIMEEFRGLLNLEVPESKLLTFVFFGLMEIEDHLRLDEPLEQRVAVRYILRPLSDEATEAYMKHRLHAAGANKMLFSKEAVDSIYRLSRGIPRLINTLCDNALFEGYLLKADLISESIVNNVARDLRLDDESRAEFKEKAARSKEKIKQTEELEEIDNILDSLTE
jgi:type II secretory pathway predicted ATPase ExeA